MDEEKNKIKISTDFGSQFQISDTVSERDKSFSFSKNKSTNKQQQAI